MDTQISIPPQPAHSWNTDIKFIGILYRSSRPVVNVHGPFSETVLLFQLGIHQEEWLAELLRAFLQRLLEQVSSTFELRTSLNIK